MATIMSQPLAPLVALALVGSFLVACETTPPPIEDAGKPVRYEDGAPCWYIYSEQQVRCFE